MKEKIVTAIVILSVLVAGCSNKTVQGSIPESDTQEAVLETSKEKADGSENEENAEHGAPTVMTADQALDLLISGNKEYISSEKPRGDISSKIRLKTSTEGQHPYAIIVTCSDSRVPPEFIFSAGIGDIFVIRLAGNVIDDQQLGSIEYAASHLECPLVMVLGHTKCGAVSAAINNEEGGYISFLTDEVKKAIGNETDELKASCLNTLYSCMRIEEGFNIADNGGDYGFKVVGAMYHIENGRVEILGSTSEMEKNLK